eukprot:m.28509 g.28509  ORF g.28509 m.28509 type:complete len:313 (+) comp4524_c0_seq1:427-1365(+)
MLAASDPLAWGADGLGAPARAVAPTVQVTSMCGKTASPDVFGNMLSGEDELQCFITNMATDQPVTATTEDGIAISPLWNWSGGFDSFSQHSPSAHKHTSHVSVSPEEHSGSEAVVPMTPRDPTAMALDRPVVGLPMSPQTQMANFFFDQNLSPVTPQLTPEPFASSGVVLPVSRALSYDDTVGVEHNTPPHMQRPSTVPRTPQKNRKRASKQSGEASPTKARQPKKAVKATSRPPTVTSVEPEDMSQRSEKSKQSARDCRRRKKMYIEGITKKAKELSDRHKKRMARIQELRGTIERLEQTARDMGLDPSVV